jgi:spermidine/putrescine-binding protein
MRMRRRRIPWLGLVPGLIALCLVAAACSGGSSSSGSTSSSKNAGKLIYVSPGGSYASAINAAYVQPFSQATGINVQAVSGGDNPLGAVQAQVSSGNVQWDLVACDPSIVQASPNTWQPIDRSIVKPPAGQLIYPEEIGPKWVIDDIEAFPVFAYLLSAFKGAQPTTWADFYNTTKFPGARAVPNVGLDSAVFVPATALLADGVPPSQLFPLDLNRAYQTLDKLKPHIRIFWTSFSQSQDILGSGDVVMNMMTDGRAEQMNAEGPTVGVAFTNGFRYTASWCVPKGAPDRANAMRFLEYILTHPKQEGTFTSLTAYGPPTRAGAAAAQAMGVKDFSTLHAGSLIPDTTAFYTYLAKNSRTLLNRWNAWVGG